MRNDQYKSVRHAGGEVKKLKANKNRIIIVCANLIDFPEGIF